MRIRGDDPVGLVDCFDETAAVVFATLCRLTAGDARRALELLSDTYAYVGRVAASRLGLDVDERWMVNAARSVYAAAGEHDEGDTTSPVAALTPIERVVVDLHVIDGDDLVAIAALLGIAQADAAAALAAATGRLAASTSGSAPATIATMAEALLRNEVWFDDAMRAKVRATIVVGPGTSAARSLPGSETESRFHPRPLRRPASATKVRVGAAVGLVATAIALAAWVAPADPGRSTASAVTNPSPPASTATSAKTSAKTSPTTSVVPVPALAPSSIVITSGVVVDPTTGRLITNHPTPFNAGDPNQQLGGDLTGYVADPVPDGYHAVGTATSIQGAAGDWFQVWASRDAARTAGRWMALGIGSHQLQMPEAAATTTRRVLVGGQLAVADVSSDGVHHLSIQMPDDVQAEVDSFGFTDDDIGRLVTAMTVGTGNQPLYSSSANEVFDGLDLLASRPAQTSDLTAELFGSAQSALYQTADRSHYLTITTVPQSDNDLFITTLLTAPTADPAAALAPDRSIVVGGRRMIVGDTAPDATSAFVRWHAGTETVTVGGNAALGVLLAAATSSHLASADEWRQLTTAQPSAASGELALNTEQSFIDVGTVTTDGVTWSVRLDERGLTTTDGQSVVLIQRSAPNPSSTSSATFVTYSSFPPDHAHPLFEFDSANTTIIVVVVPLSGPSAAAALRITVDGAQPVDVPIIQVGGAAWAAADYAFSDVADYVAEIVDANGAVIQHLDH